MRKLFLYLIVFISSVSFGQSTLDFLVPNPLYDSLYQTTYRAFLAGEGTLDYISFGGLAINPNTKRLGAFYRQGSGHNTPDDGDIKYAYSDDKFVTKTIVTIAADVNQPAGVNLSGSDGIVTSTGRTIIFYDKQTAGNSTVYFKYADLPDLSDLSAEQLYTSDYAGAYISATGSTFEYNGVLYKSNWGSHGIYPAAQPTANVIYTSIDNGLTWTYLSDISPQVDNYDEACIARHPITGVFYATLRDNITKQLIIKSSTDLGVTWGNQFNTGLPSQAKAPIVITPTGNFCVLSRNVPTFRSVLFQSNDGVNWDWNYLDNHLGAYMYGGVVWNDSYIDAVNFVEADNTTLAGLTGPTIALYRAIHESFTPLAGNYPYFSWYQCLLDYAQAFGENRPDSLLREKQNTVFTSLNSGGFLDGIYTMHIGITNDATLGEFVLRDMVRPWFKSTITNAPTYTTTGYSFNSTNQYMTVASSRVDNGGTKYTQNNAGIYFYTTTTTTEAAFGRAFGITSTFLITRGSDGNCYYRINSGGNTVFATAAGNAGGRFFLQRVNDTQQILWRNQVVLSTGSVSSTTLVGQSDSFLNGAFSSGGTPANFSNRTSSIFVQSLGFSGNEIAYDNIYLTYINSL